MATFEVLSLMLSFG
ncbi:putative holin-like toxin [Bacillus sp. 7884-1]